MPSVCYVFIILLLIPTRWMFCSHAGNVMFPPWECHVPSVGMLCSLRGNNASYGWGLRFALTRMTPHLLSVVEMDSRGEVEANVDFAISQSSNPSHNDQTQCPRCCQTWQELPESLPAFGVRACSRRDALDSMAHFRHRIMHAHTGEP